MEQLIMLAVCGFAYFLPTFVAAMNKHRNGAAIAVLNFFVGWTFVGWVIALVWACTNQGPRR